MLTPTTQPGLFEHHPADPNKFTFDKDVAAIFPDMSVRSIPNFLEAHAAHARMIRPLIEQRPGAKILDVGASRGAFFKAMQQEYGHGSKLRYYAVDNSPEMCAYLRQDFPGALVQELDITSDTWLKQPDTYDVVCCHYTLQFVPRHMQPTVLMHLCDSVAPGGILIFGHKSSHEDAGAMGEAAHEEYIRFRMDNGYTREEIDRKTKALKGSMFPASNEFVTTFVKQRGFTQVQETFRFMMFTTFIASR